MIAKKIGVIAGLLTTTLLGLDSPAEAASTNPTGYVCGVYYMTPRPASTFLGNHGSITFNTYANSDCTGSQGTYKICSTGASTTILTCPSAIDHYSEAALMAIYKNLVEASARKIRIKYWVPDNVPKQVSAIEFQY